MEHGIPREELSKIIDNIEEEIKSIHDEEWFQEYKYNIMEHFVYYKYVVCPYCE